MSDDSIPRSIILIVLILLSAFFSATETAFSYCNRIRIKMLSEDGDKRAKRVVWILEQFDRTLITILIGNNIVNIAASAIATILAVGWFGKSGTAISTVVMTLLIFLFGETIPKNIARVNSDAFSLAVSMPIKILIYVLTPIEYIFIGITAGLKKLIGTDNAPTMTEDEFSTFIEVVEGEGILDSDESQIIRSAIEFGDITVGEVMQPRESIVAIEKGASDETIRESLLSGRFSRIPVFDGTLDNVIGILQTKTYLQSLVKQKKFILRNNLLPASFISPSMKIGDVFEMMSRKRSHIAIVRRRGKTLGIVTMEDIMEEIVGDIYDEFDDYSEQETAADGISPEKEVL